MVDSKNSDYIELNEDDWKVFFSFGFAGRYIPINELIKEEAIYSAIRLKKMGLLDYLDNNLGSYGLNERGAEFLQENIHKLPDRLLFGAKVRKR